MSSSRSGQSGSTAINASLSHSLPPILQFELSGRLGPEKELPKRLDGPELPRVKQKALWGYCGSMVVSLAKSA